MKRRSIGMISRPGTVRRAQRGIALPVTMMVVLVVTIIGAAALELGRMEGEVAASDVNAIRALAAAEKGLARAKVMAMSQNRAWPIMTYNGSYLGFYMSTDPLYTGHYICDLFVNQPSGGDDSATYSVVVEDLSDWFPGAGYYRLHAYGHCGNELRHITQDSMTLTYAAFGWLTDSEDGIYFASGDVVDGWVYTNDQLNIWGNPVFTGKVNSAASSINYGHGGYPYDNPDFQQGVTLNSPILNMSTLINDGHVNAIRTRAMDAEGVWLGPNEGRPYIIDFNADGTIDVQKKLEDGSWTTIIQDKDLDSTNGAIYVEEAVGVRGTVDGQATLATPVNKDVYILDDLVYASVPNVEDAFNPGFDFDDSEFDDKLGIIAGRDIIMYKEWSEDWTDMYVMASCLAVTGSFRNDYYQSYGFKTLHLLGGIAQDTRGAVGMVNYRGFLKNYRYDRRFMVEPPPHFPVAMYDFMRWNLEQ